MQNKSNDNAPRHFNLTARILHWLMAAAILAMLFMALLQIVGGDKLIIPFC